MDFQRSTIARQFAVAKTSLARLEGVLELHFKNDLWRLSRFPLRADRSNNLLKRRLGTIASIGSYRIRFDTFAGPKTRLANRRRNSAFPRESSLGRGACKRHVEEAGFAYRTKGTRSFPGNYLRLFGSWFGKSCSRC